MRKVDQLPLVDGALEEGLVGRIYPRFKNSVDPIDRAQVRVEARDTGGIRIVVIHEPVLRSDD